MTNCVDFHSQLAAIMEVLANAAVAEICKLVDDGYAVLRVEMSRAQTENEALKTKMKLMERQFSQTVADGAASAQKRSLKSHQALRLVRSATRRVRDADRKQLLIGIRSDFELATEGDSENNAESAVNMDTAAETMAAKPELVLIKEESVEEDLRHSVPQDGPEIEGSNGDGGGRNVSFLEAPVENHRPRVSGFGEHDSGPQSQTPPVNQRLQRTGNGHSAGRDITAGSKRKTSPRANQTAALFFQEEDVKDSGGVVIPACSFTPKTDSESLALTGNPELRTVPETVGEDACNNSELSSFDLLGWKPEAAVDSVSLKMEEVHSAWGGEPSLGVVTAQQRRCNEGEDGEEVLMGELHDDSCFPRTQSNESDSDVGPEPHDLNGLASVDELFSAPDLSAPLPHHRSGRRGEDLLPCAYFQDGGFGRFHHLPERPAPPLDHEAPPSFVSGGRFSTSDSHDLAAARPQGLYHGGGGDDKAAEKPFRCPQCAKHFTHLHQLKTHQRVHTGEKPFSCGQCGKRFSQSSHIKRHMSVHTGERRYGCSLCGKRFSQSCSLKVHQSVHTGERPFSCTQCGKSFSVLGNLVRHQSVHIRK